MTEASRTVARAGWAEDDAAWRNPEEVVAGRRKPTPVDHRQFESRASGDWWGLLDRLGTCLVISREYEHLLLALTSTPRGPRQSFMSLPHPSGMVYDSRTERLHVASTRNPNQLHVLAPAARPTGDGREHAGDEHRMLVSLSASFLPGRLYLHDLALIGGSLYGNAVGLNAVVRLRSSGEFEPAWWPRAIERDGRPDMSRNYLQLNSIAAGTELSCSYFSASTDAPAKRRPGHLNFQVDRRGVIFSGATREPIVGGLTRPHSARLHDGELWVNDSGYGRVAAVRDGEPLTIARLPGWTRGLAFAHGVAFVGTSRVIPRFARYAPGLEIDHSVCGVHALDVLTGEVLGSIVWPWGNQVFDIAVLPRKATLGFAALAKRRQSRRELSSFFFSYNIPQSAGAT